MSNTDNIKDTEGLFCIEQVAVELNNRGYSAHVTSKRTDEATLSIFPPNQFDLIMEIHMKLDRPYISYALLADRCNRNMHLLHKPEWLDDSYCIPNGEYLLKHVEMAVSSMECRDFNDSIIYERIGLTDLCLYPIIGWNDMHLPVTKHVTENHSVQEDELLAAAAVNSRTAYSIILSDEFLNNGLDGSCDKVFISGMNMHGAAAIGDRETLDRARDVLKAKEVYILIQNVNNLMVVPKVPMQEILELLDDESYLQSFHYFAHQLYLYDGKEVKGCGLV